MIVACATHLEVVNHLHRLITSSAGIKERLYLGGRSNWVLHRTIGSYVMNGQDAKDFHLKLPNSLTGIPDKLLIYNLSLLPYICSFNMIGHLESITWPATTQLWMFLIWKRTTSLVRLEMGASLSVQ